MIGAVTAALILTGMLLTYETSFPAMPPAVLAGLQAPPVALSDETTGLMLAAATMLGVAAMLVDAHELSLSEDTETEGEAVEAKEALPVQTVTQPSIACHTLLMIGAVTAALILTGMLLTYATFPAMP